MCNLLLHDRLWPAVWRAIKVMCSGGSHPCLLAAGVLAPWGIVLHPAVGAVLMSLSTVVVALNAQLLRGVRL